MEVEALFEGEYIYQKQITLVFQFIFDTRTLVPYLF